MMNKNWVLALANLLLLTIMISACSASPSRPFPPGAAQNVTFVIPIEVEAFSKDATLQVKLWNAVQIKAAEQNNNCMTSYDARTGVETVQCPQGVEYQEVAPEELAIPVHDLDASIAVTSKSIRVGEQYRVQVSGLSNDDCNFASTSVEGIADTQTVTLENLTWMSTLMACP